MKRGRPALSPWISGIVRPEHIGVYERRVNRRQWEDPIFRFSFWDGKLWRAGANTKDQAAKIKAVSNFQAVNSRFEWRGRAERAR